MNMVQWEDRSAPFLGLKRGGFYPPSTISTFIFPRSVMGLTWEETMCVHLLLGHSMFDCWKDSAHDIDMIYKQYV